MSCCDQHKNGPTGAAADEFATRPDAACVLCAEKHLAYAWRLATECGYVATNRQAIVGELVAAGAHLCVEQPKLAAEVRAIRHLVQRRRESEVVWSSVLAQIDALAAAEAIKENGAEK